MTWTDKAGTEDQDSNSSPSAEQRALSDIEAAFKSCNPQSQVERFIVTNKSQSEQHLNNETSSADVAYTTGGTLTQQLCGEGKVQMLEDFDRQSDSYAQHISKLITLDTQSKLFSSDHPADRTLCAVPVAQRQLNRLYVNLDRLPPQLLTEDGQLPKWESLDAFLEYLNVLGSLNAPEDFIPPGDFNVPKDFIPPGDLNVPKDFNALKDLGTPDTSTPLFAASTTARENLSLAMLENVMLATVGAEEYLQFWRGEKLTVLGDSLNSDELTVQTRPDVSALSQIVDGMQTLRKYLPLQENETECTATSEEQAWQRFVSGEVNGKVNGKCAFYLMGNWTPPAQDVHNSASIISIPFPGTADYYMFTLDVLVMPRGSRNARGAAAFARVATDPRVNSFYDEAKGADSVLAVADTYPEAMARKYLPELPALLRYRDLIELAPRIAYWYQTGKFQQLVDYVESEYCYIRGRQGCPVVDRVELEGPR